jgi:multiple sugar transport system substrate-binding protein
LKMNRAALGMLAGVMTFGMTACGGGEVAQPAATTGKNENVAKKENITLRISWWGEQARHDKTMKVLELYKQKNPHITFEAEFASYDAYFQRLTAQAAGNNLPDITFLGVFMSQYASKDLLYDMNEFVKNNTIETADISKDILESGSVKNKLYGISVGTNAWSVIYDPDLFKKAGISEPKLGWTWNDVNEAAAKLKAVTDYGIDEFSEKQMFEIYLRQNGQHLFNAENNALGYKDDKLMTDYLDMRLKWVEKAQAPTPEITKQNSKNEDKLIVHGKAGMSFAASNIIVALENAAKRPLALAPLPGPNAEKGMYLKPSQFLSISKNSKYKEEAAKFISFFSNDVEANKILAGDRGVPISSKVREGIKGSVNEGTKKTFDYIGQITGHTSAWYSEFPDSYQEILNLIGDINDKVLYKQLTPALGAKEFRTKAEQILKR